MTDIILQKRAKWLSRRGLLELDIILSRFLVSPIFETLTDEELLNYLQILDYQDHDLLQILQGIKPLDDFNKINIIKKINSYSRM